MLRYKAGAQKTKDSPSAARPDAYRHARSVGEFFDLNPGLLRAARGDLGWNCSSPGFASPERHAPARLVEVRIARVVMAAASAQTSEGPNW